MVKECGCSLRHNFGFEDAEMAHSGEFASEKAVASYAPSTTLTPVHLGISPRRSLPHSLNNNRYRIAIPSTRKDDSCSSRSRVWMYRRFDHRSPLFAGFGDFIECHESFGFKSERRRSTTWLRLWRRKASASLANAFWTQGTPQSLFWVHSQRSRKSR